MWHHPNYEEDEEAVGEADADQPVHVEDHVEDRVDDDVEDQVEVHVDFGLRPVHVEKNHVDKTLFVQPPIGLVKVLWRNHHETHCQCHHAALHCHLEKKIGDTSSSNEEEGVDR